MVNINNQFPQLPKLRVASSNLVCRSLEIMHLSDSPVGAFPLGKTV